MSKPLKLLRDSPLDEQGLTQFDEYRLELIIETLTAILQDWLQPVQRSSNVGWFATLLMFLLDCVWWVSPRHQTEEVPPRIGLFGGFGQGKSSVILSVLEKLNPTGQSSYEKWREYVWGSRIFSFDVSYFKADDIEWRFFKALLWQRICLRLFFVELVFLVLGFTLALLGFVLLSITNNCLNLGEFPIPLNHSITYCLSFDAQSTILLIEQILSEVWYGIKTNWESIAKASLGAPLAGFVLNNLFANKPATPTTDIQLAYRDLFIQHLARWIPALPDIVIIDDLDRATVEQQRSFLKAINRFSKALEFAVVVCMDESNILASPANPEDPEELLRKIITLELRIPDRSREDIIMLVAVCVREFVKLNADRAELCEQVNSVQFVADVCRVLLLERQYAPISPRKIIRLLNNVLSRANQLNLLANDDLAALLRIDGLCRVLPTLRHNLNQVCKALEANRVTEFETLLSKPDARTPQELIAIEFFQATSMMQPSLQDGWFKLLTNYIEDNANPPVKKPAWQAEWIMAKRSFVFFRLFMDAIELDMEGYKHSLNLKSNTPDIPHKFKIAGTGLDKDFYQDDLPKNFRITDNYYAQCWLLWIATFSLTDVLQRETLYHRAYDWLNSDPNLKDISNLKIREPLLDLFWRECLADVLLWDNFSVTQRANWWQKARVDFNNQLIGQQRFYALPLQDNDYAHVWSILGYEQLRDSRKAIEWQRPITPTIVKPELVQASSQSSLPASVWSSPQLAGLDVNAVKAVFKQHFDALNVINAQQFKARHPTETPAPLKLAWQRYQDVLTVSDCLELLDLLAFDETQAVGLRWNMKGSEPWIEALNPARLIELNTLLDDPRHLNSKQQRALLIITIHQGWIPSQPSILWWRIPHDQLEELRETLKDKGLKLCWLGVENSHARI